MDNKTAYAAIVFAISLLVTVAAAFVARRSAMGTAEEDLAGRQLNRWFVGLSAATTGNSGFIVTGAVGLGYAYGVHWILMPISWFLGDLVFWSVFPGRLNKLARESMAATTPELIAETSSDGWGRAIVLLSSFLICVLLSGYASAQWLAGKKMMSGIFHIPDLAAVLIFALIVVSYSSVGGFRGSIYTDLVQAVIRIAGTVAALVSVVLAALHTEGFAQNIRMAGASFLSLFSGGVFLSLGFVVGFAVAAVGFGLGQPQVTSRYMAGENPAETQAARWIYILFIQGTWIAMTVFGIVLRGVMPDLADPETGLSAFFISNMGPLITGVIIADIFATIASTANGMLISITQTIRRNLLPAVTTAQPPRNEYLSVFVGAITILFSLVLPGTVASIIISVASLLGAGLGGVVMIRSMGWPCNNRSLFFAICSATVTAIAWKLFHYDAVVNEAGIGILAALLVNKILTKGERTELR